MQALIKCVGRELGPCFLALQICGFLGLISALAGTVSWLVWFDDGMAIVHVLATLPELMLFCVSAWLFAQGGALSNKCREVLGLAVLHSLNICHVAKRCIGFITKISLH